MAKKTTPESAVLKELEKTAVDEKPSLDPGEPTKEDQDKSELKKLKEGLEQELKELKDLLQRTQANFENYRKQSEKRIQEIRERAARQIIAQILPVLDNFELALKNAGSHDSFKEGIELIYAQLNTVMENNNVKLIETKDKMFDPYLHEALLKAESEQPEGAILEELQKGFTLQGEVIRHAKVKISSGKKKEEQGAKKENTIAKETEKD